MAKSALVALALVLGVATAAVVPSLHGKTGRADGLCTTPECVIAAAELIEAMNQSADPCQDFFQFACGGWIQKHPIPESKSRWTQFDILRDEVTDVLKGILQEDKSDVDPRPVNSAKDMYTSCMDTTSLEQAGLKPLTDLLGLFGGWPMTLPDWNGQFNWLDAVIASRKLFASSYFLEMYVYLDTNDTTHSSIYIDQGPLALSRSILVNPDANQQIMGAYATYITDAAKAIRDSLGNSAVTDEQIAQEVEDLWRFESKLANITTPQEDRRNNTRMYNPLPLPTLQSWTDSVPTTSDHAKIDWTKYLGDIFQGVPDTTVSPDERIIVVETEYLKKLVALLDETPLRTIANYVHWRLVRSLGGETNQLMIDLAFAFSKVVYGTSEPEPRWRTCVNKINNYVGFAVSAKYVERTFDETAKLEVEQMITNLQAAFKELVSEAQWMDDNTKLIAQEKADAIRKFVAYPDWIKNKTALEAYYEGLEVSATNHFGNIQSVNTFLVVDELKALRQPTDRTKWITVPSIVNAFYAPEYNSITFPAGILQPPFFGKGRLNAMNYGSIGVVIGHEITHGFDDQGRQSDKDGNTASWWTEDTLAQYIGRAQCFIDQYSNYTIPELEGTDTAHLNGINTQGENIADNGGLRESFRAYLKYVADNGPEPQLPGLEQFTPEQIFFISYANTWCGVETLERLQDQIRTDPHSPSRFRVIGPLSNTEEFAQSFSCPVGSVMNRENKCILW